MPFDFKKEYKELYAPKNKPSIVTVPKANFIAVRGAGDPNGENSEYKTSVGILYAIAFTIKMSKKGTHKIKGYFDYVVPPLEGFWWQDGESGIDYARKDGFNFISLIRLPDFVTKADFDWAVQKAAEKKQADFSRAELFTYDEGLCVQCMHEYMRENGCELDISSTRFHHEIYLSDPRKCAAEKLRTVVRHPVRKV